MKKIENEPLTLSDGLVLVFLALKLSNNFDYSWWVVFSPWIAAFIFDLILLMIMGPDEK